MFGKLKKGPPVFKQVKGRVLRCGPEPYRDSTDRFTVLLEGDDTPYRIYPRMGPVSGRCFVELTQPGDIVSFEVEEGYLDSKNFHNESLPPGLLRAYAPKQTT